MNKKNIPSPYTEAIISRKPGLMGRLEQLESQIEAYEDKIEALEDEIEKIEKEVLDDAELSQAFLEDAMGENNLSDIISSKLNVDIEVKSKEIRDFMKKYTVAIETMERQDFVFALPLFEDLIVTLYKSRVIFHEPHRLYANLGICMLAAKDSMGFDMLYKATELAPRYKFAKEQINKLKIHFPQMYAKYKKQKSSILKVGIKMPNISKSKDKANIKSKLSIENYFQLLKLLDIDFK